MSLYGLCCFFMPTSLLSAFPASFKVTYCYQSENHVKYVLCSCEPTWMPPFWTILVTKGWNCSLGQISCFSDSCIWFYRICHRGRLWTNPDSLLPFWAPDSGWEAGRIKERSGGGGDGEREGLDFSSFLSTKPCSVLNDCVRWCIWWQEKVKRNHLCL